jgi:hypothetical protein
MKSLLQNSTFNEYLNVKDGDWDICLDKSFSFLRQSWASQWVGLPTLLNRCVHFLNLSTATLSSDATQMLFTAQALAQNIEFQSVSKASKLEPRYHNRLHTADVLTSITVLIAIQEKIQNKLEAEWVACALLTAIAHDFNHSGNVNYFESEIEFETTKNLRPFLSLHKVASFWRDALEHAILNSDFTRVQKNHELVRAKEFKCDQAWLNVFLNEADVMASATIKFGPQLGQALSDEWRLINFAAHQSIATNAGRKKFLKKLEFSSGASRLLNINSKIAEQLLAKDD